MNKKEYMQWMKVVVEHVDEQIQNFPREKLVADVRMHDHHAAELLEQHQNSALKLAEYLKSRSEQIHAPN